MNTPMNYETVNAMANAVCGFKPRAVISAPIKQPNMAFDAKHLKGCYEYAFESSNGLHLDCYLEYRAAHDGGTGPTSEESWPESISLVYALVNGIEISDVLSEDIVALIEDEALCNMEMDKWDDEYDRAATRAESEAA